MKIEERKSNFELLRIVSMFLIVLSHSVYYGCQLVEQSFTNIVFLNVLRSGGKIGVNTFIFITGYFMINSNFKLKKLINLIIKTLIFSLLGIGIAIIMHIDVGIKNVIISLLPITFEIYWFMTAYILLYILSPYINIGIESLSKEKHLKLLIILTGLWVVLATLTTSEYGMNNLLWFVYIYLIGAFIRRYEKEIDVKKVKKILSRLALLMFGFLIISIVIITKISEKYTMLQDYINYFAGINRIPTVVISIYLFVLFLEMDIYSKNINKLATSCLGVYLLHENIFIRDIIWNSQSRILGNSQYFVILTLISSVIVFFIGIIFDKILNIIINPISDCIYNFCKKIENKIYIMKK